VHEFDEVSACDHVRLMRLNEELKWLVIDQAWGLLNLKLTW